MAGKAIRQWDEEFKTSAELVIGNLVVGGAAKPRAELLLTQTSPDPGLEWRVLLALALKEDQADDGWLLDLEVCPYSTAKPKTLLAVTAKGQLSLLGNVGPKCQYCNRATTSNTYCNGCGSRSSIAVVGKSEVVKFPLAEACCFSVKMDVPKTWLVSTTVSSSTVSVLHFVLEVTHFKGEKMEASKPGSLPSLAPNLKELLESGRLSDVTFVVGGEKLKAHSQVLGAASEVFAAMFSLDTKDRRTGRVEVHDASAACFREMLRCIYLASVPAWEGSGDGPLCAAAAEELLLGLLFLAEKYALPALGKHCQARLLSTLSLDNVVERLKVVDVVCPQLVAEITFPFVRSHLAEVLAQDAWAALMIDDIKLAAKVMHSAMQQR